MNASPVSVNLPNWVKGGFHHDHLARGDANWSLVNILQDGYPLLRRNMMPALEQQILLEIILAQPMEDQSGGRSISIMMIGSVVGVTGVDHIQAKVRPFSTGVPSELSCDWEADLVYGARIDLRWELMSLRRVPEKKAPIAARSAARFVKKKAST